MAALLFLIKHWRVTVAALVVLAALAVAWGLIEYGRGIEKTGQYRASAAAYEQRTIIDERLDRLSPRDLCRAAGGGDQCGGVRGGTP